MYEFVYGDYIGFKVPKNLKEHAEYTSVYVVHAPDYLSCLYEDLKDKYPKNTNVPTMDKIIKKYFGENEWWLYTNTLEMNSLLDVFRKISEGQVVFLYPENNLHVEDHEIIIDVLRWISETYKADFVVLTNSPYIINNPWVNVLHADDVTEEEGGEE